MNSLNEIYITTQKFEKIITPKKVTKQPFRTIHNLTNKNNNLKQINNVYQEKYKDGKNATGLGDFIRGSYFLMQFCEKNKINFNILINHPLKKYLKNAINLDETIEKFGELNNNNTTPDIYSQFYTFLKTQPIKNNIIKICTICFPCFNISEEHKRIMKYILEPSDSFKEIIHSTLIKLDIQVKQYIIIHIRTGDKYLIYSDELIEEYYLKIISEIESIYNPQNQYLLISDNLTIKTKIKECMPNIKMCLDPITHFGEGTQFDDEKIKNTLIDFYLITLSNKIFAFSCYEHGSGFSEWPAITFNIPYILKIIK